VPGQKDNAAEGGEVEIRLEVAVYSLGERVPGR